MEGSHGATNQKEGLQTATNHRQPIFKAATMQSEGRFQAATNKRVDCHDAVIKNERLSYQIRSK
jgi:hypothetical protein